MVIGGVGSSGTILFSTSSSSSWGKSSKISTGFSKIALLGARCRFCLLTMRSDFFSLGVVRELSAKSCNDMSLMPSSTCREWIYHRKIKLALVVRSFMFN